MFEPLFRRSEHAFPFVLQCYVHQKLGWKIQVQDKIAPVADPSTVTAGSLGVTASSAAVTAATNASACPPVPFKSNVLNFATCTNFPGGGQLSWTLSDSNFLRAAYSLQVSCWIQNKAQSALEPSDGCRHGPIARICLPFNRQAFRCQAFRCPADFLHQGVVKVTFFLVREYRLRP